MVWLLAWCCPARDAPAIEAAGARAAFGQAQRLSDGDAGRLWGRRLYGPMMFVAPATREIVANQPDANGLLHKEGDVYAGTLPREVMIANTAIDWAGRRWTMVMWPLPPYALPRGRLLAHEMFHRIQDGLRLPATNPDNAQLDTLDGRLWLQLEWRALAAALVGRGPAQARAIEDALAFRDRRHRLFPGSAESERALELNEGLAEYTGLVVSAPDAGSARWRAVARLVAPDSGTFVRAFAYASGPAYGLLLDRRLPGWRRRLSVRADLAALLAATVHGGPPAPVEQRALAYGAAALRAGETERAGQKQAEKARYRALLVDGATLTLPNAGKFQYGFDPTELVPLGDAGTVYPSLQAADAWGTLEAKEGALLAPASASVRVAAPTVVAGDRLEGPGWTLRLAPGWHPAPLGRAGSYTVRNGP